LNALILAQLKQVVIAGHYQRSAGDLCAFYKLVIFRIIGNDVKVAGNVNVVG